MRMVKNQTNTAYQVILPQVLKSATLGAKKKTVKKVKLKLAYTCISYFFTIVRDRGTRRWQVKQHY